MSDPVDAIYDDGVLKPLVPLALPDKTHVKVTIHQLSTGGSTAEAAGTDTAGDFDAELDALLFDGPALPTDFSRADIYAEHD